MAVSISNALPVQFWDESEETFNEEEVCGVQQICWCLPWNCDDEIPFQFTDTFTSGGEEEVTEDAGLPDLDQGNSVDVISNATDAWIEGVNPSITFPVVPNLTQQISEYLIYDYPFIAGDQYEINVLVSLSSLINVGFFSFYILDASNNVVYSDSGTATELVNYTLQFIAPSFAAKYAIRLERTSIGAGSSKTYTIDSITATRTYSVPAPPPDPLDYKLLIYNSESELVETLDFDAVLINDFTYLYALNIVPSVYGICNDQIIFKILDNSASPSQVIKKSDCQSIKTSHLCTKVIEYSNNRDFNNLVFAGYSPIQGMRIRIPAKFYDELNDAEQQDTELSNGEIVRRYNKLEEKRKLEVGFVPHYIHRKIQLILMHDNVEIDNKSWIRRETYEKVEGNRNYPFKRGNVWLHDKNFIKENQL